MGLPHAERQALNQALDRIASAAGTGLAALVSDGWYFAATADWWMMMPNELLLLQQIVTFAPEVNSQ